MPNCGMLLALVAGPAAFSKLLTFMLIRQCCSSRHIDFTCLLCLRLVFFSAQISMLEITSSKLHYRILKHNIMLQTALLVNRGCNQNQLPAK